MPKFEQIPSLEKSRDPFLEVLWEEYGFRGKPPFAESIAEGKKGVSSSDVNRRTLHNQIALMVSGEQRSDMDISMAKKIAEFAYEYARGYKTTEIDKIKK